MVLTSIPPDMSPERVAKVLLKSVVENPGNWGFTFHGKLIPSEFAWAIFNNVEDKIPAICSLNWIQA